MKRLISLTVAAALLAAGCVGKGSPLPVAAEPGLRFGPAVTVGEAERNPADPFLKTGPEGKVYLSWTETAGGTSGRDGLIAALGPDGRPAGEPKRINDQPGELSGHGGENLAKFTVGNDGALTAIWMMPLGQTRSGAQRISHAADGQPFSPAVTINDDGKEINHAFSSVAAAPDGRVFAAWIDGRERTDPKDDRQTLYLAVSEDGGKTFGRNFRIGEAVCPCCRTATLFLNGGKTVLVSYRYVTKPDNVRNHVLVRSEDGGKTFGEPVTISDDGWSTPGCPHAGIALAADGKGRVHAVWWTGGRTPEEAGIYYTYSDDAGRSFVPRQLITRAPADAVLHTQIETDAAGNVYAAWENLKDEKSQIFVSRLEHGKTAWSRQVQVSEAASSAVFPVLAASGGRLLVAWTEKEGETTQVKLRAATIGEQSGQAPVKLGVVASGSPRVGDGAPDFALKDLEGKVLRLSDLRGKPVVLNFFASWCEPCRSEVPHLEEAHQHAEHMGYVVLGVGVKDNRDALRAFMSAEQLSFPVVLDGDNTVTRAYRVVGPPATFFLDGAGKVVSVVYGPLESGTLAKELAGLQQ